jgi:hypothetical protein
MISKKLNWSRSNLKHAKKMHWNVHQTIGVILGGSSGVTVHKTQPKYIRINTNIAIQITKKTNICSPKFGLPLETHVSVEEAMSDHSRVHFSQFFSNTFLNPTA